MIRLFLMISFALLIAANAMGLLLQPSNSCSYTIDTSYQVSPDRNVSK